MRDFPPLPPPIVSLFYVRMALQGLGADIPANQDCHSLASIIIHKIFLFLNLFFYCFIYLRLSLSFLFAFALLFGL